MAKIIGRQSDFSGGIGDSIKTGPENSCAFSRSMNYRKDPRKMTLLPKSVKESGGIIVDLPMWIERVIASDETFIYGKTGNLYKRTSAGAYSLEHTAPNSSGNGLAYFGEDGYMYYAQDKTIGRYGRFGSSPQWYDNFLGSEGGVPTNTYSLDLESSSSQYAYRASSASLQMTGNISLEAYIKPESLPSTGNRATLISKWDESGATRSYLFDIKGISNFFLDGSDGALTISADTTDAPIDSAASGTIDAYSLSATNASFAAGQAIVIHQTQGTGAGTVQFTTISSYTAGTITTSDKLIYSFSSSGSNKAQVMVMKRYTNVTINSGKVWSAKAWNGTVGGILGFYANGTVTNNGTISAKGKGFRGGAGDYNNPGLGHPYSYGTQGEGTTGTGSTTYTANNTGGGGGGSGENGGAPGGGGSHSTAGTNGYVYPAWDGMTGNAVNKGQGATTTVGTTDLTTILFGGGGGGGGSDDAGSSSSQATDDRGGAGGGILLIFASTLTNSGTITANGEGGYYTTEGGTYSAHSGNGPGGGGAGGSVWVKSDVATLGSSTITASGGSGCSGYPGYSGSGGGGRIHLDYATSYTGTTSPTLVAASDSSINTSDGHQLRLGISSTGSNEEFYTQTISGNISTGTWARFQVTWDSTTSEANFYKNGSLLGTKYGALTAIHSNASQFAVGSNKGASAYENFFDGKIDDVRVWGTELTATQLTTNNDTVLAGTESYLKAYYKFDNAATDSTTNANDLTLSGSPVYSLNDVPFSGVTTRQDQDQSLTASGQTYTLPTTISEAATARQTFVPAKDPQKSLRVYISAVGTGNWTLTIHDALNRTVATSTVANASLNTGYYEFTFTSWRPVVGATYHFHLTSTVADGTVRTGTTADLETADFATFYEFLIDDEYHPMAQITNVLAIGNERYLATYDGLTYDPMRLTFPTGYRVRCMAFWREYLAIGVWKGQSVTDYDDGKIFFWDGISETYNFFIDVPEGAVCAMYGSRGKLFVQAGYLSDLLLYMGGDSAQKLKRLPDFDVSKYVDIYPGSMTMWQTLIHVGIAGASDSDTIERGVYTWGSLNRRYDDSLNYDYPISTGLRTTDCVKIGAIQSIGRKLLVGWQCNTSYGVDVIDPAGDCAESGTYEALIEDAGSLPSSKQSLIVRADFSPLTTGQTVAVKYQVDRDGTWTSATESTVGIDNVRLICPHRFRELQVACDVTSSSGVSPEIYGVGAEIDQLSGEKQI